MKHTDALPSQATFAEWVNSALTHLYDSVYLRKHPLTQLLANNLTKPPQRMREVRRILLNAIRGLRPGSNVPAQSPDWRIYRILELRYIDGLPPQEVMEHVGLAKSHYYREQARALEGLSGLLWNQYVRQLAEEDDAGRVTGDSRVTGDIGNSGAGREELAREEAERLCRSAVWEETDLGQLLKELRPIIESLAETEDTSVQVEGVGALKIPRADRVMLRQAILNTTAHLVASVPGGRVTVSGFTGRGAEGIRVVAHSAAGRHLSRGGQDRSKHESQLDLSRYLLNTMGGRLQYVERNDCEREVRLAWPATTMPVALAIDDNHLIIELFRRYVAGYNWQVVGATSGAEARRLLAEYRPTVIVLDVMLPQEDGWELLQFFRTNQKSHDVPVVICSVLDEPQLAEMLGASAYLAKPVTQEAFLHALTVCQELPATLDSARR